MAETKKMVVIGIDGATFNVINPLIEKGELPNLAKLIREGCRGELRSTCPPNTFVAWSTFSTGKNPGKHGVFDFVNPPYGNSEDTPFVFTNFNAIKCATFWQLLRDTDLKIGIVNLPMAYPPSRLNGFLIGGIDTPNENVVFTYPEDLISQLREQRIQYRPDYVGFLRFKTRVEGKEKYRNPEDVRQDYFGIEEERRKAILWLMENEAWDLLVVVLSLPDRVQHHFWHFHDSDDFPGSNPFKEVINDSYRKVDEIIGEMLDRIGDDVPVMVVSDHGFGTVEKVLFINHWLWENGFLSLKKIHVFNFWKYYQFIELRRTIAQILDAIGLRFLTMILPKLITEMRPTLFIPFPVASPGLVDWENTRAYGRAHGIYINLKERTPNGIVSEGNEYETIRNQIIDKLMATVDPETGGRFVETVLKKEEIFSGPFTSEAPDIFVETKNLRYLPSTSYFFRKGLVHKRAGSHKMEGIFILRGPQIKEGHHIQGAHIEDCMPTIFYMLGFPIPSDFDGKILVEAFEEDYLRNNKPEFRDPVPFDVNSKRLAGTYTSEEAEMIHERLRSLGYID